MVMFGILKLRNYPRKGEMIFMFKRLLGSVVVLFASSVLVMAGGVGLGLKVGTLGVGVEGTVGLSQRTHLRLGGNALSVDLSSFAEDEDDDEDVEGSTAEDIDFELDLETFAALIDFHPWDSGFRITAGAILNNNEITMSAGLNESVEIGDREYTVSSLDGSVAFSEVAPYVGIGYGNALDENGRWTVAFDLGVMFHGSPEIELTATASDPSLQDALNADIATEIADIEDDTDSFSYYPVLSLGLAFRF
jgi:hypothetical protein